MQPVLLVDVVGLTPRLLSERAPNLADLGQRGAMAPMSTVLPAVTCSAQATMLTGLPPSSHGAVGNGWLDRATGEVALWRQSNALVEGEKIYEAAKRLDPTFTCAKLFWWWNLGAAVDWSITPRPFYPADGRKIPAIYASPNEFGESMERALGTFPFFDFWGPKSGLPSSRWIADAAIRTLEERRPSLTMVYLPHLDYDFQRFGPSDPRSLRAVEEIDAVFADLRAAAEKAGAAIVVVSEYGILPVDTPIDVNRALRKSGLLAARATPAGEVLDTFGSRAFAVADHQVAHVYAKSRDALEHARAVVLALPGVERVIDGEEKREAGLDHPRAGDLVAIARPGTWFTYYYWLDDAAEPDFARTVDIHRKPGYDPCELFVDPSIAIPAARVALRLAQKKLGMRYLMDVIPTDARLVRGSHGRLPDDPLDGPVFLCSLPFGACGPTPARETLEMESVKSRVLELLQRRPNA
jgi:predicted AlkP superfamily pyrophosphatase or phosphodiesterase